MPGRRGLALLRTNQSSSTFIGFTRLEYKMHKGSAFFRTWMWADPGPGCGQIQVRCSGPEKHHLVNRKHSQAFRALKPVFCCWKKKKMQQRKGITVSPGNSLDFSGTIPSLPPLSGHDGGKTQPQGSLRARWPSSQARFKPKRSTGLGR